MTYYKKLVMAVLAMAVLVIAGCGADNGSSEESDTGSGDYKVGILVPGTPNDGSWGQSWAEGAKEAEKEYGATVTLVNDIYRPDEYETQASALAANGYDLIIMANGGVGDADLRVAQQFPDTKVIQGPIQFRDDSEREARGEPPNLGHFDEENGEGAFLAGALAGLVTETNKVASVNAMIFPGLTREAEAFSLGARCVNSKVSFAQKYINDWDDTALGQAAAESFISDGADVLFSAVHQAARGMIAAAKAAPRKTYVIMSYFDAYETAPDVVLTSVLYNLQGVTKDLIRQGVEGEVGDNFWAQYTLGNLDVGTLAPLYDHEDDVSAEDQATLKKIEEDIRSGAIKVPDETVGSPTIGEPDSAADIDVKDLGCTPK